MLASVNKPKRLFGAKNLSTSDVESHQTPAKRIHPYIRPYLGGAALFPLVVIVSWLISIFIYGIVKVVSPYLLIPVVQIAALGVLAGNRRWASLLGYVSAYILNIILTIFVALIFQAFFPNALGMLVLSLFIVLSLFGAPGWLLMFIYQLLV